MYRRRKMIKEVTKEKVESYFEKTSKALQKVEEKIFEGKEVEAEEILEMVKNYLADATYFTKKGDLVNAFAAINYAHGWLDCGVRLEIFDVDDDKLFTIRK